MLSKEEIIKKLYFEIDSKEVDIENMGEDVLNYYNAAGFDFKNVDEIVEHIRKTGFKEADRVVDDNEDIPF